MDTSIAFLLLAAVLFVVIVPTVLKRSAERDDEAPADRVRTVDVDQTPRCATDDSRPGLLHDASHPARIELPTPDVEIVPTAPHLSLRAVRPALEVVAGSGGSVPTAHTPWEVEAEALPMAAGESAPLELRSTHLSAVRTAPGAADVLAAAPVSATVIASAGPADSEMMDLPMTSSHRTAPRRVADAAERMPSALPADIRARLAQSSAGGTGRAMAQRPSGDRTRPPAGHRAGSTVRPGSASARPTMDVHARKRVRTLRAVLPICGLAVVGLGLLTLVFAGFVVFGSMPWGVPVITAALSLASLGLVRGLNKEIRTLRKGSVAEASAKQSAPRALAVGRSTARPAAARSSAVHRSAASAATRKAPATATSKTAAAATSAPARTTAGPTAAGPTAAGPTAAGPIVEEPITADIPVVQKTAASTLSEGATDPVATPDAKADTPDRTGDTSATDDEAAQDGTPRTASTRTRSIFAASAPTDGHSIAESLARRRAPGEWTPAVLPTPRYAETPVAKREDPKPVVADASSYALTPSSKESLAEQFAEELGYRPVLADAARDDAAPTSHPVQATGSDSPLGHGRTAIRGSGAATSRGGRSAAAEKPAQLGDILARRRA